MAKVLYVLVGLPGCGKTTWRNFLTDNNTDKNLYITISTDDYIEEQALLENKTYSEVFKQHIENAEEACWTRAEIAFNAGLDVIWDRTNLTVKSRKRVLNIAPNDYVKIAVVFPLPPNDVWQNRLMNRPGKVIPKEALDNMKALYVAPTVDEGFDYVLNILGEVGNYEYAETIH